MSPATTRPVILLVDDELRVVEGLAVNLYKDYEVLTATSGPAALVKLRERSDICVVVSDMRMPGMDGAALLQEVRQNYGTVSRILLTGEAGRDSAIAAINKGQILRFLTKPCPIESLREALAAGVTQYRLQRVERAVLQETLVGCIQALVDVLALASPLAFGRASRVQRLASAYAKTLGMEDYWQLECACLLSQIGCAGASDAAIKAHYESEAMFNAQTELGTRTSQLALQLLDRIPRLEPVIQILDAARWEDAALARVGGGSVGTGARILRLALDFDALTLRGYSPDEALQLLRAHPLRYGEDHLRTFALFAGASSSTAPARVVPLDEVAAGMVLLQDLRGPTGTLLLARGHVVTETLLQHVRNHGSEFLGQSVHVCDREV